MKRLIVLLLALSVMFALCGCGSSKSIASLDSSLSKKEMLNIVGVKPEEEGDNDRYKWSRFAKGTPFFGITTGGALFSSGNLEVAFSEEGKLLGFTFDSLYERSNKEAIDTMIDDFSVKYGNPKKETGYSMWQKDSYEWYEWTGSNIDASIIIYEDSKRVAVSVKYAAFEW